MIGPTRVIAVDRDHPDRGVVEQAAALIRAGEVVAFATETVYGLGADATNPEAVARVFEAKGRPDYNPLIVHLADIAAARDYVAQWSPGAERLAAAFWPGPLTLILPARGEVPCSVTAGRHTVGVRVPATAVARLLIELAGRPIAAPSANRSTGISPTEARHVATDLVGKVPLILDSGPTAIGLESAVIDLSGDPPRLLRPGTLNLAQLETALGEAIALPDAGSRRRGSTEPGGAGHLSPGQSSVHYAPRTPTYRREGSGQAPWPSGGNWGALTFAGAQPAWPMAPAVWRDVGAPASAARVLYATLHELDALGLDFLLIVPPPDETEWRAVRDRITRASRPWGEP